MIAVWRASRAAVRRRRVQTFVIGLVVLLSTTTIVVALTLLDASSAPFDRAFAAHRGAHAIAGYDRGAVTDEYLNLMRAAWTTDPVTFEGRYYRIKDVHVLPKPAQRGGIPIWIGGHTDAALRRAARVGDGWHPIGNRPPALLLPDEYEAKVARLAAFARDAGRDPATITLSLRVPMQVRSPRAKALAGDRPPFQGTPEQVRDDVESYAALGVRHFVFDSAVADERAALDTLARFAEDVRPKIKPRTRR